MTVAPARFTDTSCRGCADTVSSVTEPVHHTRGELLAARDRLVAEAAGWLERGELRRAESALRGLEATTVDERTLELTDPFLGALRHGRRLVASFEPNRRPGEDEVVVIYGNYPHGFDNVVVNNPIKRHVADFWNFDHDRVEYDQRWRSVDHIFIINAAERRDRYDAVLRELVAARAPLHRLTRIEAVRPRRRRLGRRLRRDTLGQIGCLSSHLLALRAALAAGFAHTLVLEDDFCFTSDLEQHLADLGTFFERRYDYLICLLATSKYGAVEPIDDLVSRSFQECTNSAAYLISRAGLQAVLPVFERALERLRAGDHGSNAIDRCWSVLQPSGRFLVFRRKLGFQGASLSDIYGSIARYLD
jgi:hypothetical protein